jgi:hypothetical protein
MWARRRMAPLNATHNPSSFTPAYKPPETCHSGSTPEPRHQPDRQRRTPSGRDRTRVGCDPSCGRGSLPSTAAARPTAAHACSTRCLPTVLSQQASASVHGGRFDSCGHGRDNSRDLATRSRSEISYLERPFLSSDACSSRPDGVILRRRKWREGSWFPPAQAGSCSFSEAIRQGSTNGGGR